MALIPYILELEVTLAGSGQGTMTYTVPRNERLELRKMVHTSTGAFEVTAIDVSGANALTNASVADAIPSENLLDGADDYHGIGIFDPPIVIEGGGQIDIQLTDISTSSNVVKITFEGQRDI